MIRSPRRSKWQDVLGFDDGSGPIIPAPTPASARTTGGGTTTPHSHSHSDSHLHSQLHSTSSPYAGYAYPHFPRGITFFRARKDDLLARPFLAPSAMDADEPQPLFYVTMQQDRLKGDDGEGTSRPDIVLHSGPDRQARIVAFAKFHSVTRTTDITVVPGAAGGRGRLSEEVDRSDCSFYDDGLKGNGDEDRDAQVVRRPKFKIERLVPTGGFLSAEKHVFSYVLPGCTAREKFEWKDEGGRVVSMVDGRSEGRKEEAGLKLVRTRTAETIALWVGLEMGRRAADQVVGVLKFLGHGMGEEGELLAVISVLSIFERRRRMEKGALIALGLH